MRVREQFEVQTFFGTEPFVRFFILDTDAENHRVALLIFREIVLEIVGFYRTATGEILGIEI